ncbi:MAG: DEAD/DEAH box helicase, partial [Acidimicrobiia bacterium]|nr:DEAD/DEAH box helicase [Acidimicrobiia bacterium]
MSAPLASLVELWRAHRLPTRRWAVPAGARAYALAGLYAAQEGALLVVVPGERDAEELVDDLSLFHDQVHLLPAWETLPFEHLSPNEGTMARRARARHLLDSTETVVVGSVRAVVQRLSPSPPDPVEIRRGGDIEVTDLSRRLAGLGYRRTDRVEGRGEFAVRGGIVDVFPAQGDEPARIDLWGDTVDDIRAFSVGDQRSRDPLDTLVIYPAREFRPDGSIADRAALLLESEPWNAAVWDRLVERQQFAGMESWMPWLAEPRCLLDELPGSVRVVVIDPTRAADRSRDLIKEEQELAEALASTWGHGAPEAGDHPALFLAFDPGDALEMPAAPSGPDDAALDVRALDATPGDAESVARGLAALGGKGVTAVVAMDGVPAADRVARVLAENGLALDRVETLDGVRPAVIASGIHRGFVLVAPAVAVLGEQEIAGRRRAHRRVAAARHRVGVGAEYRDLRPGDYVVHYRHGIGRFEGLVTRQMAGVERDYLVVAYAAGDRLYVPTDQLAAVQKYTGGETPRLSRMGGKDWTDTKDRVRKAVAAVAEEVVRLHRARARATGQAFAPDTPWQRELEAAFPFEETPDQLVTIGEVKADMEAEAPMDRLVFGDVGYGKTEIAVRAAFKAAMAGKQVAVLCPTTLLAQQHQQTFSQRFEPYPIRVEMLSRFLSASESKDVVRRLATGEVDVVIGTHRLLSDDVRFKDLGLLVIDEEQRFGVGAKDAIKKIRVGVDVLTLTATPIPRTLEMALTGIREVSHIRTPPEDRHPILTYVGPFDAQAASA